MARDSSVSIKVTGLRELIRAFTQLGASVETVGLRDAFLAIAERVASRARGEMPSRSGRAAGAVRAHGSVRGASVSLGGQAAPYGPWLDFGGTTGRGHQQGPMQGAIKRDWLGRPAGEGRYVYPAIRGEHENTVEAIEAAIAGLAHAEGF